MGNRFVSIPYRLATNQRRASKKNVKTVLFQFLIGWLQTPVSFIQSLFNLRCFNSLQVGYKLIDEGLGETWAKVSIPYRLATNLSASLNDGCIPKFQFLIGWLQTMSNGQSGTSLRREFQFLIGWLQTYVAGYRKEGGEKVSIPYRLATNTVLLHTQQFFLCVSIPYRLATNYGERVHLYRPKREFQFLIGWLQTPEVLFQVRALVCGFNSLQVGYKHSKSDSKRVR